MDATGTPQDDLPSVRPDDSAGHQSAAVTDVRVFPPLPGADAAARAGAQAGAAAGAYSLAPGHGGAPEFGAGGAVADDYNYGTGSGYGPGNGDPGDSGLGYGNAAPPPAGHEARTAAGPQAGPAPVGGSTAGLAEPPPVVGPTPALRGLPGGPGIEPAADETGQARPAASRPQAAGSMWQQAQRLWSHSGIAWQRPVSDREPAEAEWERIQSARKPPGNRRGRGGAAQVGPAHGAPRGRAGRRGIGDRTLVIGVAMILVIAVLAAAGYVISGAHAGGNPTVQQQPRPRPGSQYPSAALAGADFTTSQSLAGRGVFQSLSAVASYGMTVVAAGVQTGTGISRTQFFVSTDAGRTWHLAPVVASDGGQPPTAQVPSAIAAGPAGWLALGSGVSWTAATGRSWRLSKAPGLPMVAGDRVLTVTATATGFLAAGSASSGGITTPVIWTSPNGIDWQRVAGAQLRLPAAGAVGAVVRAAAHSGNIVIAAPVTTTVRTDTGGRPRVRHRTATDLWQSADGGLTWTQVRVPVSHGAVDTISALASSGAGFVVVRPGSTSVAGPEAVIYSATTGWTWSYTGRITAGSNANLRSIAAAGSDQGAVISATANGGNLVAYRSASGQSWQRVVGLSSIAATSLSGPALSGPALSGPAVSGPAVSGLAVSGLAVSGLTVVPGGNVVAAGSTTMPAGSKGFLAVAGSSPVVVNLARIPGDSFPERSVTAIAVAPSLEVAAGSANGQPAVWSTPPGGAWSRAAGAAPGVFDRPGVATLTSVTGGKSGWLAVGGSANAAQNPIVLFSPDGHTWRAADGAKAFAQRGASASAAGSDGSRYVVVGDRAMRGHVIAAAWWSAGLGKWNRAAGAGSGALDGAGARRMFGVAAGPFGFVAVGQHGAVPAAWTSPDGRAWRLIDLPAVVGASSAYLRYVTASGNRLVAIGTIFRAGGRAPLLAVSVNGGLTWREVSTHLPAAATLTGVTATGSGFVAVGTIGAPNRLDVVMLSSADGTAWSVAVPSGTGLSGPGAQEITALTSTRGKLLGAGFTATATTEDPTLWIAPPTPAVARRTQDAPGS
ncbi:MAG TPA: hypothetical protein VLW50_20520 [Streptosporangiaceae bacterium]|nr:hypothetical protein [Streptosporangiaceae bacterium]